MQKVRYALGLAIFLAASLYLLPALQAAENPVPDSPQATKLLKQAKTHAMWLRDDADEMHKFALSELSWESHADQISMIKEHANNLGKVLQQMSDRRESASPWQQRAIDHVTPLASELVRNIETTIEHLNKNQNRLHTTEYKNYLKANYDVSESLAGLIGDYVAYGKNKSNFVRLGSKLVVPGH